MFINKWLILLYAIITNNLLIIHLQIAKMKQHQKAQAQVNSVNGIYLCPTCKNMMNPMRDNGAKLDFDCRNCGTKQIDFSQRFNQQCLLSTKQHQKSSKMYLLDQSCIFDPIMPRVQVTCPECSYNQAIYCVSTEQGEKMRMVVHMICASIAGTTSKCGYTWQLKDNQQLHQNRVIIREESMQLQAQ